MIRKSFAIILLATLALTSIAPAASGATSKNIVEKAIAINEAVPVFDTLLTAATCEYFGGPDGEIVDALANTEDITLFAPTDRAFRKLGRQLGLGRQGLNPGNVCSLPKDTLADVLTYHVYGAGAVSYKQALKLSPTKVTMLNGDKAKLRGKWFGLRIDGAPIILPDIAASNGVIHVVGAVLTPPGL
jgi:uncharacterized surface protein with fasciclin (FAS1) repeats